MSRTRERRGLAPILGAVLAALSAVPARSAEPLVDGEWVARYDGPANSLDVVTAMDVDPTGNVYVTGYSYGLGTSIDYATAKYDPDGNEVWAARYDGPRNMMDYALALAVDAQGHAYVTGMSLGTTGANPNDIATVKYDTDGNELWVARYDGPGNNFDQGVAIAVDAAGNVFVAGISRADSRNRDYVTVAYDAGGGLKWAARYDSPGGGFDEATAIAVDRAGNVFVTGRAGVGISSLDYATIKYDGDGQEQWVSMYNGPADGRDEAFAIALDAAGNIYVTGRSDGAGTGADAATVKYDSGGNTLWAARYNGAANGFDFARAVAVGASGEVYVAGASYAGSANSYDFVTVKYDSAGDEQWAASYNGPGSGVDQVGAMAVDSRGNVYVTGDSVGSGTFEDYATLKYDADGNVQWVMRYNGVGNNMDIPYAAALDGSGNVYVGGAAYSGSATNFDFATIKYAQTAPNIPPTADAGPDRTILVGVPVEFDGSGSEDPDGSIVSYDWEFADSLATASGVTVSHSFSAAGLFTATLTVTDDAGAEGADTAVVTVQTPRQALEDLIATIEAMGLPKGAANSLTAKLENAVKSIEKGNPQAALGQLRAFENSVKAQQGKKLAKEDTDALLAAAAAIRRAL
ncbi:MAG: SBBP repeat-containing protein [Elusimicrobiota bacterium]